MNEQQRTTPWHAERADDVLHRLDVDLSAGLPQHEIAARQAVYGTNTLPRSQGPGALVRFLRQLANPLVLILLLAGVVTMIMGGITDASVIIGVVLVNAIIGFIQEDKAVQALASLSQTIGSEATVLRDGRVVRRAATDLVPGDVVLLESGDKVPADLRLVRTKDLAIAEAALTGESVPSQKHVTALPQQTMLADRSCMAYASTIVTSGSATGVVVATGPATEIGAISALLAETPSLMTPLTKAIERFSMFLLIGILMLAAVTFAVGMARGGSPLEMLLAAVALAVGAIPEGLPAAVTIILAIGVGRMAKRRAIIRRLDAVETLGSTTVICSDKTGTLTQNQMTVVSIRTMHGTYGVTGSGYEPEGELRHDGMAIRAAHDTALDTTIRAGVLCSTATVHNQHGRWDAVGDPTEAALVVLGMKAGRERHVEHAITPLVDVLPFSSDHRYMATLHRTADGAQIYLKGSVEAVLSHCGTAMDVDGTSTLLRHKAILDVTSDYAAQGLRVLAMAVKDVPGSKVDLAHDDISDAFVFCGLVAMVDPPRDEARISVASCQQAGIMVKMITGDHADTASTIADAIGLQGDRTEAGRLVAYTGADLSAMDGAEFDRAAQRAAVFARVSPEQKLRLVDSLQRQGNVVAMTGDGVNDAPALRQANIGVAMGMTGTDVAKDASDMILTDDNFSTIVNAVEEGRTVFDNLLKFIVWTIPTNIGEGLIIVAAIMLGVELPILPVQILWINMTTAVILGLPLAFEPKQPDVMTRRPRTPDAPLIDTSLMMRTLFVGAMLLVMAFSIYMFELWRGMGIDVARTASTNAFVVMAAFYLFNTRTLVQPLRTVGMFSNLWIWGGVGLMAVLQLALIYLPVMNTLFHTVPIDAVSWAACLTSGVVLLTAVAIEKKVRSSWYATSD
ncbi:MAG: HAD-IC family P-type ATPase [Candidatus Kapabacteria bacterium]|nr:HAD-IC family P-type ATPase [Candidatus Kapabacteria bacterium]